tara:strand:- start:1304 stop:1891 length:588 start_codon:yes stop_codon:yes gene_type:complete
MFNGIIEQTGKVVDCLLKNGDQKLFINIKKVTKKISIGDSIAINGTCLTVDEVNSNSYGFTMSLETLKKTALKQLKKDSYVNIETPLTMGEFISGHLVSGHIDGVGKVSAIIKDGTSWKLLIKTNEYIIKHSALKGSIAIDGISLTINEIENNILNIMIVPHTYENTIVKYYKKNDLVNIEIDLVFRYLEKIKNG